MIRDFKSLKYWVSVQVDFIKYKPSIKKVVFTLQKALYGFSENLSTTYQDLEILTVLIKSVMSLIFCSIFAIFLLSLSRYWGNISQANIGSYDNLLIAVASISGIFLSLYFTGLNTVIGGIYAKSPASVRNLLIQERIGDFSVKFIIFLTLVSLGLILIGVTLDIRPKTAIVFVVVLGCFAILFFAQLGKRAFYFFDPTSFSHQLLFDLNHWSIKATSKGLYFTNPAFQNYYHYKAEIALNGFIGLNKIAISEDQLKIEALSNLLNKVIDSYCNYLQVKKSIPTNSRWFTFINKNKNWYLSTESYVYIAALAKVDLMPSSEPDSHWLENGLEEIEILALRASSRDEITDATNNILGSIFNQFTELGKAGEIHQALRFYSIIENTLIPELEKKLPSINELRFDQNNEYQIIGLIDTLCAYLVTLVAGFFSTFDSLEPDKIAERINGYHWNKVEAPYSFGLPSKILPDIEDISKRLRFEYQVEGKTITPDWYITELIARSISFYIVDGISVSNTEGINYFKKWIDFYENEQQIIKSVVVINRGLEFGEKLKKLVLSGNQLLQNLFSLKYINLPWPEWKYNGDLNIIEKFNQDLITRLASHLIDLSDLKETERVPDYFGKAIVIIGNECFRSLDENDLSYFQAIFKEFLTGCLLTYEKLREITTDWQTDQRLIALSEPLLDLFDISGYALLYSEFHLNKQLWDTCKSTWDAFLKDDPQKRLSTIEAIYSYRKDYFAISSKRNNIRMQWEMSFVRRLRSLSKKYLPTTSLIGGFEVPDHPSKIISLVSGHNDIMMVYQPDEVFIDLYLNQLPSEKSVKFKLLHPISEELHRHHERRSNRRTKMDKEI